MLRTPKDEYILDYFSHNSPDDRTREVFKPSKDGRAL